MSEFTEFEPFNHGTTTRTYEEVEPAEAARLSKILHRGWEASDTEVSKIAAGPVKNSNNYRVTNPDGVFLLKHSHIKDATTQDLVNRIVMRVEGLGARVPSLVPTRQTRTFHQDQTGLFCVYDFIDGDHFDGSQEQLSNVAFEIAYVHTSLADVAYTGAVREVKGVLHGHDPELLDQITAKVREQGEQTEFDMYVLGLLDEITERSQAIIEAGLGNLPYQIIHRDFHPHNALFDPDTNEVKAVLDFDLMLYSQRVRDVAFGMHRFARTYGAQTECKSDVGVDIRERAAVFMQGYNEVNPLTDEEMEVLPLMIQDEAMTRVLIVLRTHYLENDDKYSYDLPKQMTTLREGVNSYI